MEPHLFKQDAKSIVDTIFETKCFREDLTRDDINAVEELVQFMLSSRFDSFLQARKLSQKIIKKELN